jgi:hypothetical protein
MRFVDNHQVEWGGGNRRPHLGALHEVDGGDDDGVAGPGIDVRRRQPRFAGERQLIENRRRKRESLPELGRPGMAESGGRQDQRAIGQAAGAKLRQDQSRLNRLAEADGVGK